MAIAHRVSATGGTTDTTSTSVVIPATVQADDILLLSVVCGRTVNAPATPTDDDAGGNTWALVAADEETVVHGSVWWKRATSGTASKTITVAGDGVDAPDSMAAGVSAYSGCISSGTPFENAVATGVPSATETVVGFTPSVNGAFVCLTNALANDQAVSSQSTTSPGALT
jgi:hypothetical protein